MSGPEDQGLQVNQQQQIQQPVFQQPVQDVIKDTMKEERQKELDRFKQESIYEDEYIVPTELKLAIQREELTLHNDSKTMERSERKKRQQLLKQRRSNLDEVKRLRADREFAAETGAVTSATMKAEKKHLQEQIKELNLEHEVKLIDNKNWTPIEKLEASYELQQKKASLFTHFARSLPLGSKERADAMKLKEEQHFEAYKLKYQLKIAEIPDEKHRKEEQTVYNRHRNFDTLASLFRKDISLSHEDATYEVDGKKLVNVGRAFLGSTKAMFTFEDRNAPILRDGVVTGYKQYFFKEAVGCAGFDRPEGAIVTESAYKLQSILSPGSAVAAFFAKDEKTGRVLGSFQEVIDVQRGGFDLFEWQKKSDFEPLPEDIKKDVIREHTLDWLMCNYDTKGENFIQRNDGKMIALDKETSFMKLHKDGAKHMNTDYAPHSENTLYNVLFSRYIQGKEEINFQDFLPQIERIESMSNAEYMKMFDQVLDQKYGKAGDLLYPNMEREKAHDLILKRKVQLRDEYRNFFTDLQRQKEQINLDKMRGSNDITKEDYAIELARIKKEEFRFTGEPADQPVEIKINANAYINKQAPSFTALSQNMKSGMLRKNKGGSLTTEQKRKVLNRSLLMVELVQLREQRRAENIGENTESVQLGIKYRSMADRVKALDEYARSLPMGELRVKAMEEKEKAVLEADSLRREYKITLIQDPKLRERELKTFKRHQWYDLAKSVFRKVHPVSREDTKITTPEGRTLTNVGRATFGGTKPMYIFEDQSVTPAKKYLFKEAVNCLGMAKASAAVVTEGASKLQQYLCGEYSIPAFTYRDSKGKVLGSFQELVEKEDNAPDLFKWQVNPEQTNLPPGETPIELTPQIKQEILREHTLDWLLCNFDTKGENFLFRKVDGHLCAFDKEASFSKMKDPGSEHMSETFKPHSNETIYNVIFRQFKENKLALNLNDVLPQIQRMEQMDNTEYMNMFTPMLDEKYGTEVSEKKTNAYNSILARKQGLREEYRTFFTHLCNERKLDMSENRDGAFMFKDEREAWYAERNPIKYDEVEKRRQVLENTAPNELTFGSDETSKQLMLEMVDIITASRNSMEYFDEKALELGLKNVRDERRIMVALLTGYKRDRNGNPTTPDEELKRDRDRQVIDDYLSGEQEKRESWISQIIDLTLDYNFTPEMADLEHIKNNYKDMRYLSFAMINTDNLKMGNPEYFKKHTERTKKLEALSMVHASYGNLVDQYSKSKGFIYNLYNIDRFIMKPQEVEDKMETLFLVEIENCKNVYLKSLAKYNEQK
ncbi:MAG: hypothetical protein FWD34_01040 [Oscillospiraceae bacterium]|nr:hypothetical protein [Oscillospiraceae bacterium]